jgi:hypothetical protein
MRKVLCAVEKQDVLPSGYDAWLVHSACFAQGRAAQVFSGMRNVYLYFF